MHSLDIVAAPTAGNLLRALLLVSALLLVLRALLHVGR
jgi:hypothetical protein